ncbi:MAG: hypothetical protein JSR64_15385 [Nitrospira sp.]|nr:hypothetical protein [Nitrospira sp.]
MKNKIEDLNNHLFEQLERLNDTDLKGDDLRQEIERSKAMSQIATQIVQSAKITVDAMKLIAHGEVKKEELANIIPQRQLN